MIMIADPDWINWVTRDPETGMVNGMREDAPEWAKPVWEDYVKLTEQGIR
jgi:hypothetical protein